MATPSDPCGYVQAARKDVGEVGPKWSACTVYRRMSCEPRLEPCGTVVDMGPEKHIELVRGWGDVRLGHASDFCE